MSAAARNERSIPKGPLDAPTLEDAHSAANTEGARRVPVEPDFGDPTDDWSVEAIVKEAAEIPDGAISRLAGLYHHARIVNGFAEQKVKDAQRQAEAIYPRMPIELRREDGTDSADVLPDLDGPEWKVDMFKRWSLQRNLIAKGLGLEADEDAWDHATTVMNSLAERVIKADAITVADVIGKLDVISWQLRFKEIKRRKAADLILNLCGQLEALSRGEVSKPEAPAASGSSERLVIDEPSAPPRP